MAKRKAIEVDAIINELIEMLLNGYSRKQIVQYCSETHEVSERQTDNYLNKAYALISAKTEEYTDKLIKQSLIRLNDLYYKNSAIQDYRECRAVQMSIVELFGLSKATKLDITSNDKQISILPFSPIKDESDDSTP